MLKQVLARIRGQFNVSISDPFGAGEWFLLKSGDYWDAEFYARLSAAWNGIAGRNRGDFALVYCEGGEDAGVWLHGLDTAARKSQYMAGCFQIPCWS